MSKVTLSEILRLIQLIIAAALGILGGTAL